MPRQIIDTESSRPAYIRRRVIQAALVLALLVAVFVVAFWAHHGFSARGLGARAEPTLVTLCRSIDAA